MGTRVLTLPGSTSSAPVRTDLTCACCVPAALPQSTPCRLSRHCVAPAVGTHLLRMYVCLKVSFTCAELPLIRRIATTFTAVTTDWGSADLFCFNISHIYVTVTFTAVLLNIVVLA